MWKIQKSKQAAIGAPRETGQIPARKKPVWFYIECLLLVIGLALLAFYSVARIESILGSRAAVKRFEDLRSSSISERRNIGDEHAVNEINFLKPAGDAGSSEVDFRLWDKRRVESYKETSAGRFNAPLALLRIPKINLEVPLLDGTDDLTLNHAVGRIAGTARPGERGNIGIAGHRDGFFRGLKNVRAGDAIELDSSHGTETYIIGEIKIVSPADVGVLRPRPVPSLTLVTCYPFYFLGSAPQRYIVTAFLSPEIKSGSDTFETPSAISKMQFKKEKQ